MTSPKPETPDGPPERKRDLVARYAQMGLSFGESKFKKAIGLGAVPNAVPVGTPNFKSDVREVHVGWHPVGGLAGNWFATQTGLGKLITEKINSYPDPTQHWAVLVGDYAHQLWMDENFDVIYTNQKIVREEWTTFPVGTTRFNDDAVRHTGEHVIAQIRGVQPGYNLITNNCQTYALRLLDAIKADGAIEFPTTADIYTTLTGPGAVADLFKPLDESGTPAVGAVSTAQAVMVNNTAQVDANKKAEEVDDDNELVNRGGVDEGQSPKSGGGKKGLGALTRLFRKKGKSASPETS